ncbi:cytochrome aa3 quinol oxidase subunit I [Bacillus sp. 1P06AnD]|uniref:cytochrome aa3 quinol oxidase subunit I n=1 Tax=Bacillus sp. 1P06AnD TaxID=3132208 RepID=UPI0039A318FB
MNWDQFKVEMSPMIYGAYVSIIVATLAILVGLTYFKKWRYLKDEWLTTVDHKRIGVMYIISALLMLFRGGVDALLMRTQLAAPDMKLLNAQHYNEIFTTHGVIMILFMAMPFILGLMNIVIPLQIGARDVAFPYLNAISFWLFFAGAMLFNISFVIGGSPDSGWSSYFPLASNEFSPTVGNNYYSLAIQISGIGTLMTGINFIVTILKMRAPGMKLMKMPMFTWSSLITCIIIAFAFPVLTVALALMMFDRLFGTQFFSMANGGNDMLWANLFWVWGHPEVYIVILPAFGIFSEIISTFAKKNLYGYKSMVISMVAISMLSFLVWVHHFYTMGQGAMVNGFFSITTMLIAVPTGVKIFNWLFTLHKGKISFPTPMLWSLAFIPIFTFGGITGVMLAMASADYQYHNTMFLVAHFHYVLIPGTVFGVIAGMYFWFPKIFGFRLNEKLGKISFWLIAICFNITFLPLFFLGLDGMARRQYTYSADSGFWGLNLTATIGALGLTVGFIVLVYNIYWSARYEPRDKTGDPWDGRTLEWSTPSPIPAYNFAIQPVIPEEVDHSDAFWDHKKGFVNVFKDGYEEIHMPNGSFKPFLLFVAFFAFGFFMVFSMWTPAIIFGVAIAALLIARSFQIDHGFHISAKELEETERKLRGETL